MRNDIVNSSFLFDKFVEENNLDFSYKLLKKKTLLTPDLLLNFGNIYVSKISDIEQIETDKTYFRYTQIKQKSSNNKILDARLRIVKDELPNELIEKLHDTSVPLGQLLQDYGINVEIKNQDIFLRCEVGNGKLRMGRNRIMIDTKTNKIICYVYELFENESSLILTKGNHLNHKKQQC